MKRTLKEPAQSAVVPIMEDRALSRTDNETLICPDCGTVRLLKPWESPRKKRKKSSASFIAIGQNNRTQAATFGCVAIQGFLRKVFPIAIKPHTSRQGGFCAAVMFTQKASPIFGVMFVTFIIAIIVDYQPKMR